MIINLTQKKILSKRPLYTSTFMYKLNGLKQKYFKYYDAIVFQNCSFIHTTFTLNNFDIVFVTHDNKICKVLDNIKIINPVHYSRNANSVICLPPNMIKASKSKLGDILDLNAEVSKSYKEELLKSNPLITASIEGSFVNLKEKN